MTRSWTATGFKATQVNLNNESLVFVKIGAVEKSASKSSNLTLKKSDVHPALGCLRGTATIACDTDLTAPAMNAWADITLNAKLHNE